MTEVPKRTSEERRHLAKRAVAFGWGSFLVAYPALAWLWPQWGPAGEDRFEVFSFGVKLLALVGLVFFVILQRLWRLQDTPEAEDVFAGQESQGWKISQRAMSNTVEQAWIFVPAFLALSMVVDAAHIYLLSMHVGLWCAARITFWRGYLIDLHWRAPGMDWTSGITIATYLWLGKFLFFGV